MINFRTITGLFIVPTLGIKDKEKVDSGFIEGFSYEVNQDHQYDDVAYLLFKPKNKDNFNDFLDNLYLKPGNMIIEDYDYPKGHIVIVHKLPEDYKEDYELIKNGKYSKTSPEFQNLFPQVAKTMKEGKQQFSIQKKIFLKTEDIKKMWEDKIGIEFKEDFEVWQGFDRDKETLNISNFI